MALWASGVGRKPCDECRAAFAPSQWDTQEERRRKACGPPCETCRPDLLPGNEEAWGIYLRCEDQLIMSMDGPVAVNDLAVELWMGLEGVEDKRDCAERVKMISRTVIAEQRKATPKAQDGEEAG